MKNWKKVILGVALSFMVFFTAIGYAELTDTLSISGTLNASAPNDIFITKIESMSDAAKTATITGLRSMDATLSGSQYDEVIYAITVKNNTGKTQVYTGSNAGSALTSWTGNVAGSEIYYLSDENAATYVSGTPIEAGGELTFYIKYILPDDVSNESVPVEFYFDEVDYTITYINNGEVLDVRCVLDYTATVDTANSIAQEKVEEQMGTSVTFGGWMNAGNTLVPSVVYANAEAVEDVTLYPKFDNLYTAMFVDQDGGLLAWCFFNQIEGSEYHYLTSVAKAEARAGEALQPILVKLSEGLPYQFELEYWEIKEAGIAGQYDINNFANYTQDVTIYARLKYPGAALIPIDSDSDGDIESYQVDTFGELGETDLVVIPSYVGNDPVTTINSGAFNSYPDLHAVVIPTTVTTVGDYILAEKWTAFDDGETVTIYYAGSRAEWEEKEKSFSSNWEGGIGSKSRIFFLNGTDTVDPSQGYYEATKKGSSLLGTAYIEWTLKDGVADLVSEYYASCTCSSCNGAFRPDAAYWEALATTSTFGLRETTPEDETTPEETTPEETTAPEDETTP